MITEYYNNGPRVVRKYYVLQKIQNMQESASMSSCSDQSQFSIMSLDCFCSGVVHKLYQFEALTARANDYV